LEDVIIMAKGKNWAYAMLALGGGFLGGLVATQLAPTVADAARAAHTIRAQRFELVDKAGTRRAALEVTPSGMSDLVLYDGNGRDRAEYRVTRDGVATLGFYDAGGARRVLLGEVPVGRNGVAVYGNHGRLLAGLTVGADDEANVTLYDAQTGRARIGLGVAATGAPALALFDEKGNDRAELHVGPTGKPGLALADETGKTIAGMPAKASVAASAQR
jgi:hypothetical protein